MRGQLRYLANCGFNVVLVSAPGDTLTATGVREGVRVRAVQMEREIDPLMDARSLIQMVKLYHSERPDISLVSTPKAGLIAGLAAFFTRTPRRIYMLRGLRLETETGFKRQLLWCLEWIALHLAHQVIVVSPSLLAHTKTLHLLGRSRGIVLGHGASNGVDLKRFEPTPERKNAGALLRSRLGIPATAYVFGFVGRLTVDKGVTELVDAFNQILKVAPEAWLLLVSHDNLAGLPTPTRLLLELRRQIRITGWLDDPALAYHAIDCIVLPTYREGFPNVPLEAAAAKKPVITTNATGAVDSVQDGKTGILVRPKDTKALSIAMLTLAQDNQRSTSMGQSGYHHVEKHMANAVVWKTLSEFLADESLHSRPARFTCKKA